MARGASETPAQPAGRRGVYLAMAQAQLAPEGFRMAQRLRGQGITTMMDYEGRSLKAQLREADNAACRFVAILGEQELKQGTLTVKDLEKGTQDGLSPEQLIERAGGKAGAACHAGTAG
jgi:histidyl-tRNA synthetase